MGGGRVSTRARDAGVRAVAVISVESLLSRRRFRIEEPRRGRDGGTSRTRGAGGGEGLGSSGTGLHRRLAEELGARSSE
jgi:hypothetical protein